MYNIIRVISSWQETIECNKMWPWMLPITEKTLLPCITRSRQAKLQRFCSFIYSTIVQNMRGNLEQIWKREHEKQIWRLMRENIQGTELQTEWFRSPATGTKQVDNFPLLRTTIILLEYHSSHAHRKLSHVHISFLNISGKLVHSKGNKSSYCWRKCCNKEQISALY